MSDTGFLTTSDGLKLHTVRWVPQEPKASVIIVHGLGEHSGRYVPMAEALIARGYAVFALDHRSHGRSEGEPRSFILPLEWAVADLQQYVDRVRAEFPALPVFMIGHSMGGLIAWSYTIRFGETLSGLVSSGAAIDADANVSPLLITVGEVLTSIIPKVPFVDGAPISELAYNPEIAPAFRADPLNYKGKLRIGFGTAINREAKFVKARLHEVRLPVLILHGADDRIVNPSGSQRAYDSVRSADKTLHLFPKMKHEIFNENDRAQVFALMLDWLDSHLPGAKTAG